MEIKINLPSTDPEYLAWKRWFLFEYKGYHYEDIQKSYDNTHNEAIEAFYHLKRVKS